MKIIKQSWNWITKPDAVSILSNIEIAGRTCYKSEDKMTWNSLLLLVNLIGMKDSLLKH